jgi:aminopeptidase N
MSTTEAAQHPDVLTQAEAEARAARVSHCSYDLRIDLHRGGETYRGEVAIAFDHSGQGDLFLDARGRTIESLMVNGERLEPRKEGHRLILPGAALRPRTTVRIAYENEYDHTGDGFHQFVDPEDGQEYLYSNFEPFEAHRLFPCFDQPDIKATYALRVAAPAEWEVISNSREVSRETLADGRLERTFETTKPFSTYLFALVAGPYHAYRDEHNGIPLGLYCRESLVRFMDEDELFTVTKQGLDFFAEFFDYPYPFGKYDQLFVPEFNPGAMENVGAVTHNEYMIFRDPPTETQRRGRAETVLHEMAHMWFGDLVTMKWWNDLWLNESFATYMAYLAIDSATRFTGAWQDFATSIKNWAYRQDQLVTTHPIAGTVASTDETFLNFDGITYGKGASVLKQLVASIGMEGFREGMRRYFRRYEYGNATLEQFLAALSEGSGHDLREWARLWLETPSLNTISADWQADGERISRMTLRQSASPEYPTVRPHYLEVGLVRRENGRQEITALPARLEREEVEVPGAQGLPRPHLVFPNYGDYGYAKVALDSGSVAFLREHLEEIDDLLFRQMLWSSLWNMVRDQQLSSIEFLALVREKLPLEPDTQLVESVLAYAGRAAGSYVPASRRTEELHRLFETAKAAVQRAPAGDAKITWARTLIGVAATPDDIAYIGRLADGEEVVEGLEIDQDMRWSIAARFVAFGLPGGPERVAAEKERDPSDRGEREALHAHAATPDPEVKAEVWERALGEGYGSLHLTSAAMSGFNWTNQRDLLEPYVGRFFEILPEVFRTRQREFAMAFFRNLFPAYRVERDILAQSQQVLQAAGEENPLLFRMLREANDDLERAIRCREFAERQAGGTHG